MATSDFPEIEWNSKLFVFSEDVVMPFLNFVLFQKLQHNCSSGWILF